MVTEIWLDVKTNAPYVFWSMYMYEITLNLGPPSKEGVKSTILTANVELEVRLCSIFSTFVALHNFFEKNILRVVFFNIYYETVDTGLRLVSISMSNLPNDSK